MARPKSEATNIAFNTIKDRINKYDLVPGDTVSDLNLSSELNMSRTPIREAILMLVQCNLVERKPHKFVVKDITRKDIKELLDIRVAIETLAVKLIIEKGGLTKEEKKELEDLEIKYRASIKAKNYNDNFKYDSQFHTYIVDFAGNERLSGIMKNITIQGERLRWMSILTPTRLDSAVNEHAQIREFLEAGDGENAIKKIDDHLQLTKENYNKITQNSSWESIIISFKNAFK
ncbi:MAG: GntR family transcriptional regulator [Sphaerochaeta sp.]